MNISKNYLYDEYVNKNCSVLDIAKACGVHFSTIYNRLEEFDIQAKITKRTDLTKELLYDRYVKQNKTINNIAEEFNCTPTIIRRRLLKFKIPIKTLSDYSFKNKINKKTLFSLYKKKKLSIYKIAKFFNCSKTTIRKYLRHCGLLYRASNKSFSKNLKGKKFGWLTPIEIYKTDTYGRTYWKCFCKCGKISYPSATSLTRHAVKSCGCKRKIKKNKIVPDFYFKSLLKSAKDRQLKFSISHEELEKLFLEQKQFCKLSGLPLKFGQYHYDTTASLDRIDSAIGYLYNNVQWVHKDINRLKGTFSDTQFIQLCCHVSKYNRLSNLRHK